MYIVYILVAVLMFGILVAIHEFGHFLFAKLCGVRVNEFSIGMGPLLLHRQKGETLYSLRLFPVGGYCAMEGEDEDTSDPRAFTAQSAWKRILILMAGSLMNFLLGLVIVLLLMLPVKSAAQPVLAGLMDGFPQTEQSLQTGDRILKIDGENVYLASDISMLLARGNGKTATVGVERDGEKLTLRDTPLALREYTYEGETAQRYGLIFQTEDLNFLDQMKLGWNQTVDFVRLVRLSLGDLLRGAVGVRDLSGPIGIVQTLGNVGEQSGSTKAAFENILFFAAFIAVNLAVMNMLPIPALDGGRIFFVLVGGVFWLFTRRRMNPKYEGYVHQAGFVLLIALMIVVAVSDVWKIVG